ncbi:MAG: DUF1957 domain-containing protein, partial [Fibrobacter sp.]|nr:DUF1957 domain-containing protein [Fibrobacter sp.]
MNRYESNPKGYLCLVLHAHLPFVRHPECDYMMEENWLYEALTETYLPLLSLFDNLIDDGVPFRLTMSLTPPLCSMLSDSLLQERYLRHINKLIELAEKEIERTANQPEFHSTAQFYLGRFLMCRNLFENVYGGDVLRGFKKFQDSGHLEIITCGATHGFLPNMQLNPN